MTKRYKDNTARGFSLIETMAVVAILGILLSLSAVAVFYYRNLLKITELDHAARQIYMAAENRAVLLDSGGQLEKSLSAAKLAAGGPADPQWLDQGDVTRHNLLLAGAVDPAVLEGDFRILYDPDSGAVTGVFYAESEITMTPDEALAIAGDRDARMRETPMLGYYGGQQAEREDYVPLPAPEVMVEVHNGDLLTVDVTFSVPSSAADLIGTDWATAAGFNSSVKADVTLSYGGRQVSLMSHSKRQGPRAPSFNLTGSFPASSITYTWVLDALDQEDGVQNRHFWQLFAQDRDKAPVCGGDFTVTAEMELSAPGRRSAFASGSDRGNSLFAERSGGDTAYLENLRHLQNLDTDTSNAGEKSSAVQLADIPCRGTVLEDGRDPYGLYQFSPIVNEDLTSFDAGWTGQDSQTRRNRITDLLVTPESAAGKPGAGLFAQTGAGMRITGVCLTGASVSAGEAPAAGVLVGCAGAGSTFREIRVVNSAAVCPQGFAGGVAGQLAGGTGGGSSILSDCWVYWVPEEGQDNLRSLLGSDKTQYNYQIVGKYAGGLAGYFAGANATSNNDTCTIQYSFASSMVRGEECAGGLLGCSRSVEIQAKNSYADCYLQAPRAAGLIGSTSNTTTIENCYAAGFITASQAAAGLCLGDVLVTIKSTYAALAYPNSAGTIYPLVQKADPKSADTYYLEDPLPTGATGPGEGKDYSEMTDKDFPTFVGGAFAFKTAASDTNPYNLQEKQMLNPPYSFPGLVGLPHYGDWRAYFKQPSLVYYEEDSTGKIGFSGGNARELIGQLDEDVTVKTDGYAVALMKKDLPESGGFTVTYNYFDQTGAPQTKTETYSESGNTGTKLLEAVWERSEGGAVRKDEYWLAPLPDELVIGEQTSEDFYQYLRFTTDIKLDNNSGGEMAAGEYFYNPHFAETVKPYVPEEEGKPFVDWEGTWQGGGAPPYGPESAAEGIRQYIAQTLVPNSRKISVSVRTPRHFFHLSQYEDYYSSDALAFHQDLPLDGYRGVYTGCPGLLKYGDRGFQLQAPIGSLLKPFLGTYNGNRLPIRRLAFQITDDTRSSAGLFGACAGTLTDIVYQLAPEPEMRRSITFSASHQTTFLGALVGYNRINGSIQNCAVEGVNLTTQSSNSAIYIGGLAGANDGSIQNCAAESAFLHVDVSNYGRAYVGGLVGWNVSRGSSRVSASYAVGRLSAQVPEDNSSAVLAGFAGRNTGGISDSYSAMDLKIDGAGAKAWGFCGLSDGGWQSGTHYLNSGNFTYRDGAFLANYEDDKAVPLTYVELTADPSPVSGMGKAAQDPERAFPYPAAVSGGKGLTHYGDWPRAMELGTMGVYYWEELQIPGRGPSYHVSLLAVDPGDSAEAAKTISKHSTLSTAHDEGGQVTRFGCGIYHKRDIAVTLEKTPHPLLYSEGGGVGQPFDDGKFKALETAKETAAPSSPLGLDRQVDEVLARLMTYELDKEGETQFQFHSFHSYGLDGSLGGLYPGASSSTPNGTLTLSEGGNQNIRITFALTPLFAGALAVEKPDKGWEAAQDVPTFTAQGTGGLAGDVPGSEKNPYGVRSIAQLQCINWNSSYRNTGTVLTQKPAGGAEDTIDGFPYLSSGKTTGKYFWRQSYDVVGEKDRQSIDKGYTPIAEYYDKDGGETGTLTGWFSGSYDGGTYSIKDVYITGQKSSCAGLFGVVYDGSLENIVLYSTDGKGVITTKAAGEMVEEKGQPVRKNATESRWFAIGGLAGVAGTSDQTKNAIQNCAVAGYTILAEVYTFAGSNGDWGGGNIGGLVGASHMNLSNCTAQTDVIVQNAVENDNMRVGGLAGSCQGTVQNCYAGGSIRIDSKTVDVMRKDRGIYVGGLVGGSYMKSLEVGKGANIFIGAKGKGTGANAQNETNNSLLNCYSCVTLPPIAGGSAHQQIKSMYVIGGTGEIYPKESPGSPDLANHGVTTYDNCYFLTSEVLTSCSGDVNAYLAAVGDKKAKTDLGSKKPDTIEYAGIYKVPAKTEETITKGWIGNWNDPYDSNYATLNGTTYYYTGSYGKGTQLYLRTTNESRKRVYTFAGWFDGSGFRDKSKGDEITGITPGEIISNPEVTGLTYEQLAGMQKDIPGKDPGKDIYDLLNEGKTEGTDVLFKPVTTETKDGLPVPGKYSYPPSTAPQLRDRDYPFPAILTQGEGEDVCRVHYGGWPLKGFQRQTLFDGNGSFTLLGGSPIEADLFINGDAPHQEHLVLTAGVTSGGAWSFQWKNSPNDPIAHTAVTGPLPGDELPPGEEGKSYYPFTLTPKRDGTDILRISYAVDGNTYVLEVTVHITAAVELRPSRLFMFPGDTVTIDFWASDKAGAPLDGRTEGRLTLKGDPNCGDNFLTARTLIPEGEGGQRPAVQFTTAIPIDAPELERELILGANTDFAYTVPDPGNPGSYKEYGGGTGGDIRVEVIQPWKGQENFITFAEVELEDGSTQVVCTITFPDSFQVGEEGTLRFRQGGDLTVTPMPKRPTAEWLETKNSISLTLTYPAGVTSLADLPEETRVSVPLSLTGGGDDGGLIEGSQLHTLTLTVVKPEISPELPPEKPEFQSIDALPPPERRKISPEAGI